jgi:hypothetical protein
MHHRYPYPNIHGSTYPIQLRPPTKRTPNKPDIITFDKKIFFIYFSKLFLAKNELDPFGVNFSNL